jgi:hypothetical protein
MMEVTNSIKKDLLKIVKGEKVNLLKIHSRFRKLELVYFPDKILNICTDLSKYLIDEFLAKKYRDELKDNVSFVMFKNIVLNSWEVFKKDLSKIFSCYEYIIIEIENIARLKISEIIKTEGYFKKIIDKIFRFTRKINKGTSVVDQPTKASYPTEEDDAEDVKDLITIFEELNLKSDIEDNYLNKVQEYHTKRKMSGFKEAFLYAYNTLKYEREILKDYKITDSDYVDEISRDIFYCNNGLQEDTILDMMKRSDIEPLKKLYDYCQELNCVKIIVNLFELQIKEVKDISGIEDLERDVSLYNTCREMIKHCFIEDKDILKKLNNVFNIVIKKSIPLLAKKILLDQSDTFHKILEVIVDCDDLIKEYKILYSKHLLNSQDTYNYWRGIHILGSFFGKAVIDPLEEMMDESLNYVSITKETHALILNRERWKDLPFVDDKSLYKIPVGESKKRYHYLFWYGDAEVEIDGKIVRCSTAQMEILRIINKEGSSTVKHISKLFKIDQNKIVSVFKSMQDILKQDGISYSIDLHENIDLPTPILLEKKRKVLKTTVDLDILELKIVKYIKGTDRKYYNILRNCLKDGSNMISVRRGIESLVEKGYLTVRNLDIYSYVP